MERIKRFIISAATKVANYMDSHEKERILLGCSLASSSAIIMLLLAEYNKDTLFGTHLFASVLFLIGLQLITGDVSKVEKFLKTLGIEVIAFILAIGALYLGLSRYLMITQNCDLTNVNVILTYMSIFYLIAYFLRMGLWLFSIVKKIASFMATKLTGTDIEGITKKIGEVLKNIVSIAGTIGIIYAFIEPIIMRFLGL